MFLVLIKATFWLIFAGNMELGIIQELLIVPTIVNIQSPSDSCERFKTSFAWGLINLKSDAGNSLHLVRFKINHKYEGQPRCYLTITVPVTSGLWYKLYVLAWAKRPNKYSIKFPLSRSYNSTRKCLFCLAAYWFCSCSDFR